MNNRLSKAFAVSILSIGLLSFFMIFITPFGSAEFYISIFTFIIDFIAFIICIYLIKRKEGKK